MQDVDGNEVGVGDVVKVLDIDTGFLEWLTDKEKASHLATVGNDYIIDEIVEEGLKASISIEWEIEDVRKDMAREALDGKYERRQRPTRRAQRV